MSSGKVPPRLSRKQREQPKSRPQRDASRSSADSTPEKKKSQSSTSEPGYQKALDLLVDFKWAIVGLILLGVAYGGYEYAKPYLGVPQERQAPAVFSSKVEAVPTAPAGDQLRESTSRPTNPGTAATGVTQMQPVTSPSGPPVVKKIAPTIPEKPTDPNSLVEAPRRTTTPSRQMEIIQATPAAPQEVSDRMGAAPTTTAPINSAVGGPSVTRPEAGKSQPDAEPPKMRRPGF